jgi:hypothetical protein
MLNYWIKIQKIFGLTKIPSSLYQTRWYTKKIESIAIFSSKNIPQPASCLDDKYLPSSPLLCHQEILHTCSHKEGTCLHKGDTSPGYGLRNNATRLFFLLIDLISIKLHEIPIVPNYILITWANEKTLWQ